MDAADDTTLAPEDATSFAKSARPAVGIKRAFLPEYAIDDNRLSRSQLRVLAKIYCYYNPRNPGKGCWPTQETIAQGLGIKRTHVNRAINDLAALGYLEIRKKGRRNYYYPSDSAPSDTYQNAHMYQNAHLSNTYQNAHMYQNAHLSNTYQNAHPSTPIRTKMRTYQGIDTYQFADTEHTTKKEHTTEEIQNKNTERSKSYDLEGETRKTPVFDMTQPDGDFELLAKREDADREARSVADREARSACSCSSDPFHGIWDYEPPADPDAPQPPLELAPSPSPPAEKKKKKNSTAKYPPCPHDEILALWRELLPHKPQPRDWNSGRKATLRTRWIEGFDQRRRLHDGKPYYVDAADGLDWWRWYFTKILKNDFLGADTSRWLDLDWVIKRTNFNKITEGKYDD